MAARKLFERLLVAGLGGLALIGGLTLGSMGCSICNCNQIEADIEPIRLGAYEIVQSPARAELVGGMVEVESQRVEISITNAEGEDWVIDYIVERKH